VALPSAPRRPEIWQIDVETGEERRRVGSGDLVRAGLDAEDYDLLELAWSPDGDRLAFTWFDGMGWGQVAISDPDGIVRALPPPAVEDPWEPGERFLLSTSDFQWDSDSSSGSLIAWDDDCGTPFHYGVLPPATASRPPTDAAGSSTGGDAFSPGAETGGSEHSVLAPEPIPLPGPPACRPDFLAVPGFRLLTEFGEEFTQQLLLVTANGHLVDSVTFPQGRSMRLAFGEARQGAARPTVLGWWSETDSAERVLFAWETGALVEWHRERCAGDCAGSLAGIAGRVLFLDGPPDGSRLLLLEAPGASPREILPEAVGGIEAAPDGRTVAAIRWFEGLRSLWLVSVP
jgi:hypothetical protein